MQLVALFLVADKTDYVVINNIIAIAMEVECLINEGNYNLSQ